MIGKLTGKAEPYDDNSIIIDVHGVGYIVHCPSGVVADVYNDNDVDQETELTLFIESVQPKDKGVSLYGFSTIEECRCFRILTGLQGLGGKIALLILSSMSIEDIMEALDGGNADLFQSISGIGPKLAKRIVVELCSNKSMRILADVLRSRRVMDDGSDCRSDGGGGRGRSGDRVDVLRRGHVAALTSSSQTGQFYGAHVGDAVSAIVNLGFSKAQVIAVVGHLMRDKVISEEMSVDMIVKKVLSAL